MIPRKRRGRRMRGVLGDESTRYERRHIGILQTQRRLSHGLDGSIDVVLWACKFPSNQVPMSNLRAEHITPLKDYAHSNDPHLATPHLTAHRPEPRAPISGMERA
jgi:hypothetical protein